MDNQKFKMPQRKITLRTKDLQKSYDEHLKLHTGICIFCAKDLLIKEYKFWVLLQNKFPYNKWGNEHWLLAPKRHVEEEIYLLEDERIELYKILASLNYNMQILNKKEDRSVPHHFHYHLLTLKKYAEK